MIRHTWSEQRLAAFLLLLMSSATFLSGCASVPDRELGAYNSAFSKAQSASVTLYKEMLPVYAAAAESSGAIRTASVPSVGVQTDLSAVLNTAPGAAAPTSLRRYTGSLGAGFQRHASNCEQFARYPSLETRCQAFALAARYNELIVKLSAGAPRDEVESEVFGIQGLIGPLAETLLTSFAGPIAGIGFDQLKGFLDTALQGQSDHEILVELRKGLPEIEKLVQLLKRDVQLIYDSRRVHAENQLSTLHSGLIDKDRLFVNAFKITPRPSASDARGASVYVKLQDDYRAVYESLSENAEIGADAKIAAMADWGRVPGPPLSGREGALGAHLQALEAQAKAFKAVETEWRAFEQALTHYSSMLDELERATKKLSDASQSNFDLIGLDPLGMLAMVGVPIDAGDGLAGGIADILAQIYLHADSIEDLLSDPGAPRSTQ